MITRLPQSPRSDRKAQIHRRIFAAGLIGDARMFHQYGFTGGAEAMIYISLHTVESRWLLDCVGHLSVLINS